MLVLWCGGRRLVWWCGREEVSVCGMGGRGKRV